MLGNSNTNAKNIKLVLSHVQNWMADPDQFKESSLLKIDPAILIDYDAAESKAFLEVLDEVLLKLIKRPVLLRSFHLHMVIGIERFRDKLDIEL